MVPVHMSNSFYYTRSLLYMNTPTAQFNCNFEVNVQLRSVTRKPTLSFTWSFLKVQTADNC